MAVAALVVSIVALVGVMLTVSQVIWGKPQITIGWGIDDTMDGGKALECRIWNEPLTGNPLKRCFCWRRPVEDLTAMFDICEDGSREIKVSHNIPKIRNFSGDYAQRIRLPASWVHASFGVVYILENETDVKLFRDESRIIFSVGRYQVLANIIADGKSIKGKVTFEVTETKPYLHLFDS